MAVSEPWVAGSRAFRVPAPALVFGGVVSLEGGAVLAALLIPTAAAGAILGLLALGQRITLLQWAGIVAVVIASVGVTRAHRTLNDRPQRVFQAGREGG